MKFLLSFLLVFSCVIQVSAQTGLRGLVKNSQGETLPYAAVIVKGTPQGTITNTEGRYEIPLPAGKYDIVFQFLGYQTVQKSVTIESGFAKLDATLEEQAFRLAEVQTKAGNEDPAYTIMRRAIAKSRFHQLQVQRFKARVYTKSSFTITDLPNLAEMAFRKQLKEAEKEANFKVGVPLLNETVAEVSFSQPNTYRQRIIANRNSQGDFLSPNQFYNASFYNPTIAGAVSPLSPKAFAYYKFEYKGTFREPGPDGQPVEVSKIQVIPRQYGEGVFRGTIFILENTWAIYSLQLETITSIGLSFTVRHMCRPIKGVWMPTNQRYDGKGSYLGVKGEGQYVRNLTFTEFVVNPAFVEDIEVTDEKKAPPAQTLSRSDIKGKQFDELVKKQKEFSTKNLKQLVKEYEKQEKQVRKERKEDVTVVRDDSLVVDSLARRRSNVFWDSLRSVPLTMAEVKSYRKADSLGLVKEIKAPSDTVKKDTTQKKKAKAFSLSQIIFGHSWRFNKFTTLNYSGPLTRIEYNTVEGYALEGGLYLRHQKVDSISRFRQIPLGVWNVGGNARYQFGRKQFVGYGLASYQHKATKFTLSGGRYFYQFNPDNPISPFLNTLTTLLFEQNFAKLYQKDFLNLTVTASPFKNRVTFTGSLEYAERSSLQNFRENIRPWINWRNRSFTSNDPTNVELVTTQFGTHQALVLDLTATGRLGATQYTIRNGRRITQRDNDSPLLSVNYRKGFSGIAGSDVDYDFLQASIQHSFETGIRSRLNYKLGAGAFLNDRSVYFPDFKHFAGNQFFLQQGDPTTVFRLLPYYEYSTGRRFVEGHVLAEFRKFLITQVTLVRLVGLKENLFIHYLYTPRSRNYTEIGYGLDGLIPQVLPFFRLEVISQWQNARYQGLGFRVGTTLKFGR
ncbi:DUF5686 and carboxypeptidase regulatory-like domain-containing protein [Spirosoma pomorum]